MKSYIKSVQVNWSNAWLDTSFRWKFLGALIIFMIFPWKADDYFQWIQLREGMLIQDIVLANIPALNVSIPIFGIIYLSVIFLLFRLLPSPLLFLWFAWAFNLETFIRLTCIFFIPLNPPVGLVDLHDPLAEIFIYGENLAITKDLFFSGHTATMIFVCFFLTNSTEKKWAIVLTILLMALLLIQHVHYTMDVLAAPFFTIGSIYLIKKWMGINL
ncbi:phosphatase PAP2-related protein [Aquirufa rosea]|uniref:Phosphatase PAP2 family protein n=1 Tax=Aquirufa rosea TaxID=2509241 RepID=A0A4Q1BYU2_9BACT|nr:phosphatase PAP2-related protein [Aquirufa rosea]RXK48185.1 phosphatase PAP2 family protein [Aquirufa rosea]